MDGAGGQVSGRFAWLLLLGFSGAGLGGGAGGGEILDVEGRRA